VPFFWNSKIADWLLAAGDCAKSFTSNTDSNPVLKGNSESFSESKIDKVIKSVRWKSEKLFGGRLAQKFHPIKRNRLSSFRQRGGTNRFCMSPTSA
jgi:hypothetical protein